MKLEGNAPFIVFDDVDAAVEGAMAAKTRTMGEACTAANRFLAHRSVADEFARELARRMSALVVGPGTRSGIDIGPLIDAAGRAKVENSWPTRCNAAPGTSSEAIRPGGRATSTHRPYSPRSTPAAAMSTEISGPVAAVLTLEDKDKVLRRANDTPRGSSATSSPRDWTAACASAKGWRSAWSA
ncbi:aldehyde dehydrogenase family protein [Streptomyces caniscabiei]|nr:aldehyde dehydrogenase family protein [Streptomyces caniscabiei]MDX2599937.1 aldehyde dehydrogenase family protein [Streptomyces caniscabiei]